MYKVQCTKIKVQSTKICESHITLYIIQQCFSAYKDL